MRQVVGRVCAVAIGALAVGACQPQLKSTLPSGPAAYSAIDDAASSVPVAAYALRPGDKLAINIFQEDELSQDEVQIDDAGMISMPMVGEIRAAGLSSSELARQIEEAYLGRRILRQPQATVLLRELRPRTVSVEGEVEDAGVFEIEPGYTLLSALALAGSPTNEAKHDEVLVFRTVGEQRLGGRFDLTEVRAGRMADPLLMPGDVIVVGYSRARAAYEDVLQMLPGVFGAFVALVNNYNDNSN